MGTKTVPLVGLIISVVVLLALAISMNWASFEEDSETEIVDNIVPIPNRYQAPAVLTAATVDKWGAIPGEFESNYTTTASIDTFQGDFLSLDHISSILKRKREANNPDDVTWEDVLADKSAGSVSYAINKESNLTIISSTNDDIEYRPVTTFDTSSIPVSQLVATVNYDALSIWWQMENMPSYLKGWQALRQIANKFYQQDFLSFYYANQLYASYFSNPIWVNAFVLQSFSQAEQDSIYYDKFYGMQSIRNLTVWVSATLGNQKAIDSLTSHYFNGTSTKLNATQLGAITASNGQIMTLIGQLNSSLISEGIVSKQSDITNYILGSSQWATSSLLNNPMLGFDTYYAYDSMQEIEMNFLAPPEFARSGCSENATSALGQMLFNDVTVDGSLQTTTFMSPPNYYDFETSVSTNDFAAIQARWGMSQTMAICVYSYVNQQAVYNTYQASANLAALSLNNTIEPIYQNLAIDLASRFMAYLNRNQTQYPCSVIFTPATGAAKADTICAAGNFDFSNITTCQYFIEGPWYNNANMAAIMSSTNMTEAEYWSFYDPANSASFGADLDIVLTYAQQYYHCPDAEVGNANFTSNCSAAYLAQGQWGGSMVTNNPPSGDAAWFPKSLTLKSWNATYMTGQPMELQYYADTYNTYTGGVTPNLTAWQVANITSTGYTHFGLGETYNGKQMFYSYQTLDSTNPSTYMSAAGIAFGLTNQELYSFIGTLEVLTEQNTLGGLLGIYSLGSVLFGYESDLIQNINAQYPVTTTQTDNSWQQGNAMLYESFIAPTLTANTTSARNLTVLVVANSTDNTTGKVKTLNGYDYPNTLKEVLVGDGTSVMLPTRCSWVNFTTSSIYTWMQNEPGNTGNANVDSLNLDTLMVQNTALQGNSTICTEGTGAECDSDLEPNPTWLYSKMTQMGEDSRCTNQLPLSGTGSTNNAIDQGSGLATAYGGDSDSGLSISALMSPMPGTNSMRHLHPFPSLKAIYEAYGTETEVPLSSMNETFTVTPSSFINVEYPVNTTQPTIDVKNGTKTETTDTKEPITWSVSLYSVIMAVCVILIVIFTIMLCKGGDDGRVNDILGNDDEVKLVNPSEDQSSTTGGWDDKEN